MKFARVKLFVLGLVERSQTGVVLSPAYFVNTLCTTHRSTDALHSVTPAALSTHDVAGNVAHSSSVAASSNVNWSQVNTGVECSPCKKCKKILNILD